MAGSPEHAAKQQARPGAYAGLARQGQRRRTIGVVAHKSLHDRKFRFATNNRPMDRPHTVASARRKHGPAVQCLSRDAIATPCQGTTHGSRGGRPYPR